MGPLEVEEGAGRLAIGSRRERALLTQWSRLAGAR